MADIDISGFAKKIEEFHQDQDRPEKWFHHFGKQEFDDDSVESRLCIPFEYTRIFEGHTFHVVERYGLDFNYTMRLVMELIERSYNGLQDGSDIVTFSRAVVDVMQNFAQPFPDNKQTMCYPHFLFHGLVQPNLEAVVDRLNSNSRIIHETLEVGEEIIEENIKKLIGGNLQLAMSTGCTDDYFGIAYLLAREDAILLSSACSYIAKASFFVDSTNHEIYVITLQGINFDSSDLVRESHHSGKDRRLETEKEYGRIGNFLKMGPRRFILEKVVDFAKENKFKKVKVIKPEEHPMFIERHNGFLGNYESVIRKAGITDNNGCYLEKRL